MSRRVSCRNDAISAALSMVALRQASGFGFDVLTVSDTGCESELIPGGLDVFTVLAQWSGGRARVGFRRPVNLPSESESTLGAILSSYIARTATLACNAGGALAQWLQTVPGMLFIGGLIFDCFDSLTDLKPKKLSALRMTDVSQFGVHASFEVAWALH